ncbi:MAG: hypothetical protein K0U58_04080, partial [Gammaproteobacteria bacterium]|nr:hypothetical protein [Gammaproteobacteria bacterium]
MLADECRELACRLSVIGYRLSVIGHRRRNPLTELNVKPVRSVRCFKRGAARLRIKPTHSHTEPAPKRAQFDQV